MNRHTAPQICFDRYLPEQLNSPMPGDLIGVGADVKRAIFMTSKLWPTGSVLNCAFLDGTPRQQTMVAEVSAKWADIANLTLRWGGVRDSHLRVTFNGQGAWSYIAKDALFIPRDQPTLCLGWQDEAVILHEFGHALGMCHEHQSPNDNPLVWNEPAVYRDLGGPPNYWDLETIRSNVLRRYSTTQVNGSAFDPASIMLYSFPADWTVNGYSTQPNSAISVTDEAWMRRVYPGRDEPTDPDLPAIPIGPLALEGAIGQEGEEDQYLLHVAVAGNYVVETHGSSDTVLSIISPLGAVLVTDDDSGSNRNASVRVHLEPGRHKVSVRHYGLGVGGYGITARHA